MDSKEYQNYLQSDHWKHISAQIKERDGYKCQLCGSTSNLHVHHKTYEHMGHEEDADLITLCSNCHEVLHICLKNAKAKIEHCNNEYSDMFYDMIKNDDRFADLNESWAIALGNIYAESLMPFVSMVPPVNKTKLISLFNAHQQLHGPFGKKVMNERIRLALFRKGKPQYPFTVAMQSFSKIIRQKRRF